MTTSEDRAEWERELYVPSDFAATRPSSDAQPRSGVGASPSTREASAGVHGAEGAQEAAYAEAIDKAACKAVSSCNDIHKASTSLARAVMAVADAEQAELRAEVERLRSPACAECGAPPVTCAAAPIKCCPDCSGPTHQAAAAGRRLARAEAAETEVERLRAEVERLADEPDIYDPNGGRPSIYGVTVDRLRAVLADAAPDPTPNTGERARVRMPFCVCDHGPEDHSGGTGPCSAPALPSWAQCSCFSFRESALSRELNAAASSVDDKAGESGE